MAQMKTPTYAGGGGSSIWDNWPDLSDGTTITAFSNRITNMTKNKAKKIGTDVYIEIAGDMSVSSSNSGYDSWKLTDAISVITSLSSITMDMWNKCDYSIASSKQMRGFFVNYDNCLTITTYGSGSYTGAIDLKIILHNQ